MTEGSYRFTGRDEPDVLKTAKVDLWAQVYRPTNLGKAAHPLLILLHGNHGTCGRMDPNLGIRVDDNAEYTIDGTCPDGYTVTPNHLGYAYLARALAAEGYVVVSINANRGITAGEGDQNDSGLNLARGRLILRHLALLSDWNRGIGTIAVPKSLGFNPKGMLDFAQVGLFGHSRGGEGTRAALAQWRDPGSVFPAKIGKMTIRSIFEIGPVDGQTSRVLDSYGVASMILLPSCDGDVSTLEGVNVFDRAFTFKGDKQHAIHGTFEVWGADHNAYNTEWLEADSASCSGTPVLFPQAGRSKAQQQTALVPVLNFFKATVGPHANPADANLFDPSYDLPATITKVTHVQRGYLPAAPGDTVKLLETFSKEGETSDAGLPYGAVGLTVTNGPDLDHPTNPRIAHVTWSGGLSDRHFDVKLVRKGAVDLSHFATLSLRTAIGCTKSTCDQAMDPSGEMEFKVRLIGKDGKLSAPVSTKGRIALTRPVGTEFGLHRELATVSFDLASFHLPLNSVTGLRFVFDSRPEGDVDIGTIAVTTKPVKKQGPVAASALALAGSENAPAAVARQQTIGAEAGNTLRFLPAEASAARRAPETVRIELTSQRRFPFTDSLPELSIGDLAIRNVAVVGDGRRAIAQLTADQAKALVTGSAVSLQVGSAPLWRFGTLPAH
ncbi:hypothetical protein [Oryzibacter oryziterrae]|uniref:hypothetical protein n=1 Tax=Oryzibacter oryziterrae TaxID=2766474 RepID=UPI001F1F5D4C|nr:hypothetical protein [Oryzibacter oryziterrae]